MTLWTILGLFGFRDPSTGRFSPQIRVATFHDMREIVIAGDGLSAALRIQLERELAEGLCALLPVTLPWLTLNYDFITKRGPTLSPPTAAFMAFMRGIESQLDLNQTNVAAGRSVIKGYRPLTHLVLDERDQFIYFKRLRAFVN